VSGELTPHARRPGRSGNQPWLAAGIVAVLAAAVVVAVVRQPGAAPAARPPGAVVQGDRVPSTTATTATTATTGTPDRAGAIRALLARRARAIRDHDRAELLATIDPTRRSFAAAQARMLANLRQVPLAGWYYTVLAGSHAGRSAVAASYPVPTDTPTATGISRR
jgi:hypothetical protein